DGAGCDGSGGAIDKDGEFIVGGVGCECDDDGGRGAIDTGGEFIRGEVGGDEGGGAIDKDGEYIRGGELGSAMNSCR
ncbi:hypothetical protein A2U01_0099934, partial [Trifolium medium]|nr:hypothetical protein [Trifolium medium]